MWEYKKEIVKFTSEDNKDIIVIMNEYSKSGWEIFSVDETDILYSDGIRRCKYVLFMKKLK